MRYRRPVRTVFENQLGRDWRAFMPDDDERRDWVLAFGVRLVLARRYRPHFTDADAAKQWHHTAPAIDADIAAYLHARRIHPNTARATHYLFRAEHADRDARETATVAALTLTHPDLAPRDITLLLSAGLTLAEIDTHLATGIDRPLLKTLAGLR